MVRNAEDALRSIARSTVLLDQGINPCGLAHNLLKAEHVATFLGPGQDTYTKTLQQALKTNNMGKVKQAARYLGAWPHFCGHLQTVVNKRCAAAKEAYYGLGKAWRTCRAKRTMQGVFNNMVVNALLSGLEAETLRECDYSKLEKCMIFLARTAVGERGVYVHEKHQEATH